MNYGSCDTVCKSTMLNCEIKMVISNGILKQFTVPGMPNHELKPYVGLPVMHLCSINQGDELCHGKEDEHVYANMTVMDYMT